MRRIINSTYMSMDGVVQDPQNWTFDYRDDAAETFAHDQLFSCDALVMGRLTYETFSAYWPTATDMDCHAGTGRAGVEHFRNRVVVMGAQSKVASVVDHR